MNASYNIAKQMQIMLGRISEKEVMTDDSTGKGTVRFIIHLNATAGGVLVSKTIEINDRVTN